MSADRARLDRIEGVLLGSACGDALGVPSDFSPNGFVVTALQAAWSAIRHPWGDGPPVVASLVAAVRRIAVLREGSWIPQGSR